MNGPISKSLNDFDAQVRRLAQLLVDASAGDLLATCAQLQAQAARLQADMQQRPVGDPLPTPLALRLRQSAAALTACQQSLARRTVLTGQTLQTLLPALRRDTYSVEALVRGRTPYGSAGRQSGEFQALAV